MKTVLIAHFNPLAVSGAEKAIADMIRGSRAGWRFVMLTPGRGRLFEYYTSLGLEVWPQMIQTRRRKYPGLHTMQSVGFARQLKKRGVDAVVCNTFPAASRVGLACRLADVPYAIFVREFIRDTELHRRMLGRAQQVFAVSDDLASYLSHMMSDNRPQLCHDSVDAKAIRETARSHRASGVRLLPFPATCRVVGIVGRITTYKQQDLFLRAIPQIVEQYSDARFAIVGGAQRTEREYERSLRDLAVRLHIADKVVFMGDRPDAVEIMSELTALCMTSDREPFPRVVLEAQAIGIPVVASNTGGCPEMIEHGVTGLLFGPTGSGATIELAEAVNALLANPGANAVMAHEASERLQTGLASGAPIRRFEALVTRLCEAGRGLARE